jgi:hypothetical protein
VITRAREFLMRLQPNQIYRRTNWSMTIGRTLDVSVETLANRAHARAALDSIDDETFGRVLHLRVEVQHLIRLAESGAICFLIRTYMLPLADVATVDAWRDRMASVLAELPDDIAEYKGISGYRDRVVAWLRARPR